MDKFIKYIILCCFASLWAECTSNDVSFMVEQIQVEMKTNPEGIDVRSPRFSWKISSDMKDVMQKGYRIQVASSLDDLENGHDLLWDSGVVESSDNLFIPYCGKELKSRDVCYWRVKVDTSVGNGEWSKVQKWSMGLLDDADWQAQWIGENSVSNEWETDKENTKLAARYLRTAFGVKDNVKKAMLYISGLGLYEAYINGKRVGTGVLAPTPSLYPEKVYYNTYDVTGLLSQGANVIGVVLGNGRYFPMRNMALPEYGQQFVLPFFGLPRLLAQLEVEYYDGHTELVLTDGDWKVTSKGPIVENNEYDGETYDARKELKGWNTSAYDDSEWKFADVMDAPGGKLLAQPNLNIEVQDSVVPKMIFRNSEGNYIVDMGQNMVGWLKVNLKGEKNKAVNFRFAELLNPDNTLYVANLRNTKATDTYIPAADGIFCWQPKFVYHGFRYVEINGLDYEPMPDEIIGYVVYDKMETTGHFECSNDMLNRIYRNAFWGIRGNYRGMPTDCPQRDERMGWLGDRATGASGEAYLFNNALMYAKWLQDIEDSQDEDGQISHVSPNYWRFYEDEVTWSSAFIYVAEMLHRHYGDDSGIRKHYDAMRKYMKHIEDVAMKDYIIVKDKYGDWCMPPEKPELIHSQDPARITEGAILSTTVYYDLLHLMKKFARISGNGDDAEEYEELAVKIKEAYNKKFFDSEAACYGNNTVTANMLSLYLGLVPEGFEQKVFDNIVEKTETDFNGHVSTGVVGIQYLMRGLSKYGRKDLAYKIATNEDYPSWGYMVNKGATTIWELWNGDTANPAMNSANHVMLLGDLLIWYYEDLAGIRNAPGSCGFKKILMQPIFPDGLDYVDASYNSVTGLIKSNWKRDGNKLEWKITIPANSSAVLYIPKMFNVKPVSQGGVHSVDEKDNAVVVEIGSGEYMFKSLDLE